MNIILNNWKRFENTDTEVLIGYYQSKDSDETLKEDAFLTLCFRFREDLLNKCEIICKNRGHNIEVAQEVTENTFKKYWKSGSFKIGEGRQASIDDCFRVYLYKIAKNELINYYNLSKKRERGQLYDGTEGIIKEIPNFNIENFDVDTKIIHETLMSLNYSQRVIYLTYTAYEKADVNLPRKLQADLREHLGGIKQNTLRTYKKEAMDKMEGVKKVIARMKEQL